LQSLQEWSGRDSLGGRRVKTYYVDETGFTGEDLLAEDQPIFVQAANDFSGDEARRLIAATFGGLGSAELKYSRLARGGRHHDRIVEFIRLLRAILFGLARGSRIRSMR
jgi:hypothetical protein